MNKLYCTRELYLDYPYPIIGGFEFVEVSFKVGKMYKYNDMVNDGYMVTSSDITTDNDEILKNHPNLEIGMVINKFNIEEHFITMQEYRKQKIDNFLENN